jgi:acetolactate synthase-1/3 small subunit
MRHIIAVLVENESGALSRIAGLFAARGFNIESLTVAATNDATLSRMTIVSIGSDRVITQIVKQLNKLIDVYKVLDLTSTQHIERELLLLKISIDNNKQEIESLVNKFSGKIINETDGILMIEFVAESKKINEFISEFDSSKVVTVARTGVTGARKGNIENSI